MYEQCLLSIFIYYNATHTLFDCNERACWEGKDYTVSTSSTHFDKFLKNKLIYDNVITVSTKLAEQMLNTYFEVNDLIWLQALEWLSQAKQNKNP